MNSTSTSNQAGEVRVRVARTAEEVEALRPIWENAPTDPNADLDIFMTVINTWDHVVRPHVVILERGDKVEALIAARLERIRFDCRLGYKSVYHPEVLSITAVYGGAMSWVDNPDWGLLVKNILESLRNGEAQIASFHYLRPESKLFDSARSMPGFFFRDRIKRPNPHLQMVLPKRMDEFYSSRSKKSRSNLRTYANKLKREFGDELSLRQFSTTQDVDELMRHGEEVAGKTYQRGMAVGFRNDLLMRRFMLLAAKRGWLRSYILYRGERPVAFQMGFHIRDTYYVKGKGYDPEFHRLRPGTFLFLHMLKEFCEDEKMAVWDFGLGDADYKRLFGNEVWEEASVYMFAPSLRGFWLSAIYTGFGITTLWAEKILKKTNLLPKIKRFWKRRLTPPTRKPAGGSKDS